MENDMGIERILVIILFVITIGGIGLNIYYGISGQSPWGSVILGIILLVVMPVVLIIFKVNKEKNA
jgi:hypothetical protein